MIDTNGVIRAWLLTDEAIKALVNDCIYYPLPPEDYSPDTDGPAISFSTVGGQADEEAPIVTHTVQMNCWASAGEHVKAREVYRAVYELMHTNGANGADMGEAGIILSCGEEVAGQDSIDPDTKWATVISHYRLMIRAD